MYFMPSIIVTQHLSFQKAMRYPCNYGCSQGQREHSLRSEDKGQPYETHDFSRQTTELVKFQPKNCADLVPLLPAFRNFCRYLIVACAVIGQLEERGYMIGCPPHPSTLTPRANMPLAIKTPSQQLPPCPKSFPTEGVPGLQDPRVARTVVFIPPGLDPGLCSSGPRFRPPVFPFRRRAGYPGRRHSRMQRQS